MNSRKPALALALAQLCINAALLKALATVVFKFPCKTRTFVYCSPPLSDSIQRFPMSFFAMEGGNDYPYGALRPKGPPVLDEGSPFSDLRLCPLDPQVILLMDFAMHRHLID